MFVVIAYIFCAVVWGTTWFAIRVCIGDGGYPTIASAAMRFTIAAMILQGMVRIFGIRPRIETHRERVWLTLAGLFNGTGFALVYLGEESVSGAFAAILFGTLPLVTAVLAIVSRTEAVSVGHIIGSVSSLAGISIIFWDRLAVSYEQAMGIALLCCAVLASSFYSVILKREATHVHPIAAVAWFLTVTALGLWLTAFVIGQTELPWPLPVKPTLALLYLAVVGSVCTFASYLYLLQRTSLMTTSTLVFIQPIIALWIDSKWEADVELSVRSYLGAGITMGGVVVAVLWKRFYGTAATERVPKLMGKPRL